MSFPSPSSSPLYILPSFESLDDETQNAYHCANKKNFAPVLSLLASGADALFVVRPPVVVPDGAVKGTSFLSLALRHRDLSTARKLLSFWSPETRPNDPLLPLSVMSLINPPASDATSAAEGVELFRLLLDHGLDLNCDTSPSSPLGLIGFQDGSIVARIAAARSLPLMRVALEPQYKAIVDKGADSRGTALAQAVTNGDTEMMGVLIDAGADASWRSLEGDRLSLVTEVMFRLAHTLFSYCILLHPL